MCVGSRLFSTSLYAFSIYVLYSNITSWTSTKITLVFCLLFAFVKQNFVFTLRNNGPAKTWPTEPFAMAVYQGWNQVSITDQDDPMVQIASNPGQTQIWPSLFKVEACAEMYISNMINLFYIISIENTGCDSQWTTFIPF